MMMGSGGSARYQYSLSINHNPEVLEAYNSGLILSDPRASRSLAMKPGQVATGQQLLPNCDIASTEYYSEISMAGDVMDSVHGILADDAELGRVAVSFQRGFGSEFFGTEELAKLKAIMPQLREAISDSVQLYQVIANDRAGPSGSFCIVDSNLWVVSLSDSFEESLGPVQDIGIVGRIITCYSSDLEEVFRDAVLSGCGGRSSHFRLGAGDNGQALVRLGPLPKPIGWLSGSIPYSLMTVSTQPPRVKRTIQLFACCFGLTPRETDVLGSLIGQPNARTAACSMNIAYETYRTYLKSIMQKTGYSHKHELLYAAARCDLTNLQVVNPR